MFVPLRFRILNGSESTEQLSESENISQRGLYFTTSCPLEFLIICMISIPFKVLMAV